MKRGIRSMGSMNDIAEFFNDAIKNRASETFTAGKFVANKVFKIF
jgi:hypothetical protein